MSNHVLIQDPNNLSSRFSNSNRLGHDADELDIDELIDQNLAAEVEEDLTTQVQNGMDFSSITRYFSRIPAREGDLLTLYYMNKMKQEQIAKLFGITQAAVSYRLHRGIKRIQFLRTIPELERGEFNSDLDGHFCEQDMEILWRMYETTCQSEIAKQMKLTQGRVRHRFFRALQKIKDLIAEEAKEKQIYVQMLKKQGKSDSEIESAKRDVDSTINKSKFGKYYTVFFNISDKRFNICHEVSLPQFRDRGDAQILPID